MIGSQRDTNPAIINFGLSSSVFQEPQMSLISKALGILSVQNEQNKNYSKFEIGNFETVPVILTISF